MKLNVINNRRRLTFNRNSSYESFWIPKSNNNIHFRNVYKFASNITETKKILDELLQLLIQVEVALHLSKNEYRKFIIYCIRDHKRYKIYPHLPAAVWKQLSIWLCNHVGDVAHQWQSNKVLTYLDFYLSCIWPSGEDKNYFIALKIPFTDVLLENVPVPNANIKLWFNLMHSFLHQLRAFQIRQYQDWYRVLVDYYKCDLLHQISSYSIRKIRNLKNVIA